LVAGGSRARSSRRRRDAGWRDAVPVLGIPGIEHPTFSNRVFHASLIPGGCLPLAQHPCHQASTAIDASGEVHCSTMHGNGLWLVSH
jgi:hypothetical protein